MEGDDAPSPAACSSAVVAMQPDPGPADATLTGRSMVRSLAAWVYIYSPICSDPQSQGVRDASAATQRRDESVDAIGAANAGPRGDLAANDAGGLEGSSARVDQLVDGGAAAGVARPGNAPSMGPLGPPIGTLPAG